ncbi:MAG: hypothetical protein JW793_06430 [Acidobacteria bacterium]|nr:hypothetical protein [Acidobacteriota bacterium]
MSLLWIGCGDKDNLITGSWNLHQALVKANLDHVWYVDTGGHEVLVWNNNLYLMAQMLFQPVGSVTPPPSIGSYNGEPVGAGFGGMGMGPGRAIRPGPGMTAGAGGAGTELTARREKGATASPGAAGKWLIRDGENEIELELKTEGSRLTGTIENRQMPGAIAFKEGKAEGNRVSFSYVRQVNGQDMTISWTETLSGDEIKFKREVGGGMGMPPAGRGTAPKTN